MKKNSKKIIAILGILIGISVILPGFLSAKKEQQEDDFCARISELALRVDQRITNQEKKLEEKRSDISNRLQQRWDSRDTKLTEKLAKWTANRAEHYTKLAEKVQNEEQKETLDKFKITIETAIANRTSAIKNVMQSFRQGVEEALISRKSAVDKIVSDFRNSVREAFERAKSDCERGEALYTLRENLRASLESTKEKFVAEHQAVEKLGPQMSQLVTTRNEALQETFEDFRTAVAIAREELKTAFSEE